VLHAGSCHCGAIAVTFESALPLRPRACQCSFCRMHDARSVSDPDGAATITAAVEPLVYRFASRAADYLLCPVCGVYVGAATGSDARLATLNLNAFDDPHRDLPVEPVSYDSESAEEKAARRRARWTPLRFSFSG
jgi:hypothetical protein